jgi:hypothetical protein
MPRFIVLEPKIVVELMREARTSLPPAKERPRHSRWAVVKARFPRAALKSHRPRPLLSFRLTILTRRPAVPENIYAIKGYQFSQQVKNPYHSTHLSSASTT